MKLAFAQSLRFKITAGVTLAMVILVALYTYFHYDSHRVIVMRDVGETVTDTAQIIEGSLQHAMLQQDYSDLQSILDNVGKQPSILTLWLLDKDSVVRFAPGQRDVGKYLDLRDPNCQVCHQPGRPADRQNIVYTIANGARVLRNCNPIENQPACYQCHDASSRINGVLITDYSLAETDAHLVEDLRVSLFLGGGVIGLVILITNLLMDRLVLARLDRIGEVLRRFGQGDLSQRVDLRASDELGRLAETFNRMASGLEEKNRENTRLYDELQQKEAARAKLLETLIDAQEEERKRVARDLHDQLGATLSGLTMNIEAAEQVLGDPNPLLKERWQRTRALATQALEETHKLILALRPIALDELGLVAAVRSDAEARLQPRGINVQVRVTGARRRIAPQLELTLFRIAQEAINNIAKHAQAQHVGIMFEFRDAAVHVLIQDDGQGFDPAAPRAADPTRGLGLLGMAERAQHAGGTLQIDSQAGRGTRIAIAMPTPAEVG